MFWHFALSVFTSQLTLALYWQCCHPNVKLFCKPISINKVNMQLKITSYTRVSCVYCSWSFLERIKNTFLYVTASVSPYQARKKKHGFAKFPTQGFLCQLQDSYVRHVVWQENRITPAWQSSSVIFFFLKGVAPLFQRLCHLCQCL